MAEHVIQQRILLAHGSGDTRLWRNNVGTGWQGRDALGRRSIRPLTREDLPAARAALRPGDIVIRDPRPLHAGLCVGSSDLIGYRTVIVTPQDVGNRLAVFAAVEVKSGSGRPTPQQTTFLNHIRTAGGRAGIARSVDDAREILMAP